jgi:DNA-binding GntR family transcriptional regulator
VLRHAFDDLVKATHTHDPREIVTVDLAFHAAIVAMLSSRRIDAFYADLITELHFYLMVLSVEDREYKQPDGMVEEHRRILTAIESGETARAAAEIDQHIQTNAARVREILLKR